MKEFYRIYFLFFSIKFTNLLKIILVSLGAPRAMSLIIPFLSTTIWVGKIGVKPNIKSLLAEPN